MTIAQTIDNLITEFNLHKNFWILASFSHSADDLINHKDKNTKYKYLVYNIQIIPYTCLSKAVVTRLQFFNLPYINIIQVRDYFKNPEGRPLQWQHTDDSTDKNFIRFAEYTYPDFFKAEMLDFFFSPNSAHLDRTYFLFHSSFWFIIMSYFRYNKYIITGGSLQNRGIHTDLQKRVSRFLEIYGLECPRGFHGKLSPILKPQIDFKSKYGLEKYEEIILRIRKDSDNKDNTILNTQLDETQLDTNSNRLNSNSSNNISPFSSNSQNRKLCTISNLKSNIGFSDRIPASVYNTITNNLTPHLKQSRCFTSSQHLLNNLNNNLKCFDIDLTKYKNNSVKSFIKNYSNNPLYMKIRSILEDNELNYFKKQKLIEETLTDFWRKEILSLFRNKQKLFRSEYGIKMIYNNIIKLDRDLQDLKDDNRALKGKKYKLLLKLMSNPDIVSIVLSIVIPFCIKFDNILDQNIVGLFEKVGKEIEKVFYRCEWYKYLNRNKKEWNDKSDIVLNNYYIVDIKTCEIKISDTIENMSTIFEDKLTENEFIDKLRGLVGVLTDDDYFKLGSDLIEFISAKSYLFYVLNKRVDKDTTRRCILPGDTLKTHILDIITQDSDLIPMITKPINWVFNKGKNEGQFYIKKYGGFISNKNNKNNFLKKSHKNIGLSKLHNLDLINAINYLSSIKYCINHDLLKIILDLLDNSDDRVNKLINITLHPKTKDIFDLSNEKNKQIELYEVLKHNSQYYCDRTVLQTSLLFSRWCSNKNNSIYFPLFVDWRGRILTNTGSFSYQQGELARSLVLFRDGQILNKSGLESLKIYTANCFGKDKLPYNKRLTWVDENIDNITKLDLDFIFKADEPFLFLSCCLELKGYFSDPNNFISRLPIYKDATCNGLQHLSLMISDINLAKYVNILISSRDDVPQDVYSFMVTKVKIKIKELIDIDGYYSKLLYINIIRKFIKRAIMTIPYGATVRGIVNQLKTEFFKLDGFEKGKPVYSLIDNKYNKDNLDFNLSYKEINALGKILHDILYETFDSLKLLVSYFKKMNQKLKTLNLNPIWLTPGGLTIEQKYVFTEEKTITSKILGKRKSITRRTPIVDEINLKKQNEGIVPNIVHSFDASNISLLIKELLKNKHNINILTIHDCFATNANNVELMVFNVKVAFSMLYSNKSFVDNYHNFILDYIVNSGYTVVNNVVYLNGKKINKLPTPPCFANFKDFKDNILGSQYFIN
jgi:hypothetical protein